jgi:probable HAF family extracellular repeat protein
MSGTPNAVPTDLGTLGGDESFANDINNVGQVVGISRNAAAQIRPVLWQSGTPSDLGTLGGARGDALAINDLGQIVGSSQTAANVTHATLWMNGTPTALGTLGGTFSQASDINQLGQIVGGSTDAAGSGHPLLWMDGAMYDLGNPPGSTESFAVAINNLGEVVGVTSDTRHFVLWQVAMRATIDIAPGTATNALKLGGAGTLSVAVLGSRYFDAAQIDPRTVTLGNEDASDTPVSRKKGGQPEAAVRDLNRDGYADLVLDFDKKQMAANGDLSASTTELVLLGSRLDGRRVRGVDTVTVK